MRGAPTPPPFRWFAWHPVWTDDRGWRWLRPVWRRRCYISADGCPSASFWEHQAGSAKPDAECSLLCVMAEDDMEGKS